MSVESTLTKRIYQANGDTREWPVPFAYSRTEDLRLILTTAEGRETEIGSDFRVDVNASGNTSVTYPLSGPPLPCGVKLTVYRSTPLTQIVDLIHGDAFNPDVLEKDGFDRLEMQIQELRETADRAITTDISSGRTPAELLDDLLAASSAADRAEAAADRAEESASGVYLESGVYNVRAAFTLTEAAPAGSVITLPAWYYPTRNVLYLAYAGTACTPGNAGIDGGWQYEEIGSDPNTPSNQVTILFDAEAGVSFDMWVVTSALGKNLDQLEALAGRAASSAWAAEASASGAATAANAASEAAVQAQSAADSAVDLVTARTLSATDNTMVVGKVYGPANVAIGVGVTVAAGDATPELPGITRQTLRAWLSTARNCLAWLVDQAGTERVVTKLTAALAAGANVTVPPYIVGGNKLRVWYNGARCAPGTDPAIHQYKEVGASGSASTVIQFYDALNENDIILAEVK